MVALRLDDVSYHFPGSDGGGVSSLSLTLKAGAIGALVGPSGCGKTTTLRLIAGLLSPERGRILLNGTDVTGVDASHRSAVMVFQDTRLFPFLTVAENVAFGLRARHVPTPETRRRCTEMLRRLGIENLAMRRPHEISGGQAQRVALARALVVEPDILLLDEPFSGLDRPLRADLRDLIATISREIGPTILFVTHDQEDAAILADTTAMMRNGEIVQTGSVEELYRRPRDEGVARHLGVPTLVEAVGDGEGWVTPVGRFVRPDAPLAPESGRRCLLACAPDTLRIAPDRERTDEIAFPARVISRVFLGAFHHYTLESDDGTSWTVASGDARLEWSVGDQVVVAVRTDAPWPVEPLSNP